MTGGVVSYCVNIYLWDLELLVPLPPFSPSCSGAPVSEAVHMNSCLLRHCCICLHFMCTTQRDVYPPRAFFFLFLFSSFPYREWANSRPCRIPNTSVGPLRCRATLHYLPTSIFSSGSVPAVLYYSWKNLTNCRDLSFAVGVRVSWGA